MSFSELCHWLEHCCVTEELFDVHLMMRYGASGDKICTAIIFEVIVFQIYLSMHC